MNKTNDGGFAFPQTGHFDSHHGMTLRDYFAGQALAGYLAMHSDETVCCPHADTAADLAYGFADAMLAARKGEAVTS